MEPLAIRKSDSRAFGQLVEVVIINKGLSFFTKVQKLTVWVPSFRLFEKFIQNFIIVFFQLLLLHCYIFNGNLEVTFVTLKARYYYADKHSTFINARFR